MSPTPLVWLSCWLFFPASDRLSWGDWGGEGADWWAPGKGLLEPRRKKRVGFSVFCRVQDSKVECRKKSDYQAQYSRKTFAVQSDLWAYTGFLCSLINYLFLYQLTPFCEGSVFTWDCASANSYGLTFFLMACNYYWERRLHKILTLKHLLHSFEH